MPTAADSLRLAISPEISQRILPADPAFEIFRTTGEGLQLEVTSTISDEISATSRGVTDSILTGATVSGDISFELADFDAFEMMMTSLLASDWGEDPRATGAAYPASIGTEGAIYDSSELKTFAIEKRFTAIPVDGGAGKYVYQFFTGCMADTMTLSITPNEIITGSFGFVGAEMTTPEDETGASYGDSGLSPVMTAPLVTGIELLSYTTDGSEGTPVTWLTGSCFTGLEVSVNNNGRGLVCIGTLGNVATALGRFEVTLSGSLYYVGDEPLDALIDQTPYQMRITLNDSDGSSYFFFFPRVKFATANALASGTNTDVMVEFTMNALVGEFRKYSMALLRTPTAYDNLADLPPSPPPQGTGPITADPATGLGTTTVLIPMGGGPAADQSYTATLAITATGGSPSDPGVVAISAGDDLKTVVMPAIAAAFAGSSADIDATVLGDDIQITASGSITSIDTASVTIT